MTTFLTLRTRDDVHLVPASHPAMPPVPQRPGTPPADALPMPELSVPAAPTCPTMHDLLTLYEQEYLPRQAATTQRQKRGLFKVLRRDFGAVPLDALTAPVLRQWRDTLSTRLAPGSVTRYLLILSSVLRVAVNDLEWLTRNPMTRVPKPTIPTERVRFLSAEEQASLLSACQHSRTKALSVVVLLALTTGMRRNEIMTLRWEDVDFTQGTVRLTQTKNKLRRAVPMPQMTIAALRAWQDQGAASPYLFPAQDGLKPASIMRAWYLAMARAQLDDFRFHDLRHTAASYLAQSGVRIEDIAEVLGHKSLSTTRRYRHLSPSYMAEKVERMSRQFVVLPQYRQQRQDPAAPPSAPA